MKRYSHPSVYSERKLSVRISWDESLKWDICYCEHKVVLEDYETDRASSRWKETDVDGRGRRGKKGERGRGKGMNMMM